MDELARKRGGFSIIAALVLVGVLVIGQPPAPAAALKATGGTGRFIQAIDWFQWGTHGQAITNGSKTNTYTVAGQQFQVTCAISNIGGTGGLIAYRPGNWQGDGLDELYNIGGTGNANQLVVGLANGGNGGNASFDFSCSAQLGSTPIALAGLVMADAEQSGPLEWVGATIPAGATWRIIDRYRAASCAGGSQAVVTNVGPASRLELGRSNPADCGASGGPMAVAFMDGATAATNVVVRGGGKSAIALGVMLNLDFGDAPASYGDAGAVVQYAWSGGALSTGTTNVSVPGFGLANSVQPTTRLGANVDADSAPAPTANAAGDDVTGSPALGGPDDEDTTVPSSIVVRAGDAFTMPNVACNGAGTVAGWIDWNRDGDFNDTAERSADAACTAGAATLSWPAMPATTSTGGSFLRLRMAASAAEVANPTGVSATGEVEDHAVRLMAPPRLTLAKQVAARVAPIDQFTVTMAGAGLAGGAVSATTSGTATAASTATQFVQTGQAYTLTDAMAAGSASPLGNYTTSIACVNAAMGNAPVTVLGSSPTWSVANLDFDWDVRCTITNAAKPPSIDVAKAAAGAATGPAADGSYTVVHTVTVTNSGPVAGTYGALTDTPAFASNLVVDGASWTTSGTGAPAPGSAPGAGPFALAAAGTTIGAATTHTFTVTIRFHYANRSAATACTGAPGGGLYDSVALPGGQEQGPATNNAACTPPPPPPAPAITFDKVAGAVVDRNGTPAMVDAGDEITFNFTITNSGNVTLDPVAVSDPKVGPVNCGSGPLAPGAQRVCTAVTYTLTQGDVESGAVANTATASGTPPQGPGVTATDSTSSPIPSVVQLTIDKSSGAVVDLDGNGPDTGDRISYTFVVTNTGNRPLSSVAVTDPKVGPVTCPAATLAPGASTTCTKDYTLTQTDVNAGGVSNTATATGTPPGGLPVTTTDTDNRTFSAAAAIVLDKRAGALADPDGNGADAGDQITFDFDVTNTGAVTLDPVTVDDPKLGGALACGAGPLAPGATRSCTAVTYTLAQTDVEAGAVVNTATATGTPPSGPQVTSSDSTTTAILSNPKIDLVKTAGAPLDVNGSTISDANDTIEYTFTVTNLGNRPLDPVTIDDPKIGPVACPPGPLAPGGVRVCGPVTYPVSAADAAAGRVDNAATVTGTAPNGQVVTAADDTTTPVTLARPLLTIDKRAGTPTDVNGSGITDVPDTISYTFTVTNTGNVPIADVAVTDAKVGAVACLAANLAPGASTTCTPTTQPYVVTAADVASGAVANSATATGTDPDDGLVTSPPDTTSTPTTTPAPALTIDKQAATPTDVNGSGITDVPDTISYTFTVTNTGNVPIAGVAVGDPKLSATPIACASATLAPGASTTCGPLSYAVSTGDEVAGRVLNTATATGTAPGGPVTSPPDTTTTTVTTPHPALLLDKEVVGAPVDVNGSGLTDGGDTITYRFTVTNTGNVPIRGVAGGPIVVADTKLPGSPIACAASTLAPGASTTCGPADYPVSAADASAGVVGNTATAHGIDPDNDPIASNEDSTSTPATAPMPKLTLVKTADRPVDANLSGIVDAGDTIQYRFTVTNDGNVPIAGVGVADVLAGPVTCAPADLDPGDAAVCAADVPYSITPANQTAAQVVNTAGATGTNPDGGTVTSNDDTTTTPVTQPAPSLNLVKRVGGVNDANASGITDAGDVVIYEFVVTNTGNVPIGGVTVVEETLPGVTPTCPPTDPDNPTAPLAVDGTLICTATYTVLPGDETAGRVNNVAHAAGTAPDQSTVLSNDDDASVAVTTQDPQFVVTKTAATPIDDNASGITDAGDHIQYTFTVINTGNVPLTNIVIQDDRLAPASITCVAAGAWLAPQASVDCAVPPLYAVTEADEDAGAVTNLATGTATDPDDDPVEFPENPAQDPPATTTTPVTKPDPKLTLFKVAGAPDDVNGSGNTDAPDTVEYTFTVRNDGNVPIRGADGGPIVVVDTKVSATPVACTAATLAPGAATACGPVSYAVQPVDESAGAVANSARASGIDPDGGAVTSNVATTTTPVTAPQPKLTLTKSAGDPVDVNDSGLTDAGDTIRFTFVLRNTGNVPVRAVSVVDPLAGVVVCDAIDLAAGATTTCRAPAPYVVTEDDETAGHVVNTATASGTDPNDGEVTFPPDPEVDPPATTTTPVDRPDPKLMLEKIAGDPDDVNGNVLVDAGDTIRFTFRVTNGGNVPIDGIAVTDAKVGSVTCARQRLLPTESVECAADQPYTVTQAEVDGGEVVNGASAGGADPDGEPITSNPSGTDTPADRAPALQIAKQAGAIADANGSGRVDAADTIPYTFTVTNIGTVTVTGIAVHDDALGAVMCPATPLVPGASTTCTAAEPHTVSQDDVDRGSYSNVATATGVAPTDETVTSNVATATTSLAAAPGLTIAKTARLVDVDGDGRADIGETIEYTFVVTNTGNVRLAGVTVVDPMLAAVGSAVSCPASTLDVGASLTCTAAYVVRAADISDGAIRNTATATAQSPGGEVVASAASSTTTGADAVSPPPPPPPPPDPDPDPQLPATGGDASAWLQAGLALVAIGIHLVVVARRRRRTTAPSG